MNVGRDFSLATKDRDWPRLAVVVWALLLTAIAVRVLLWPRTHTLYPIFAAAGLDWLRGDDLYFVEHTRRHGLDHFRYSPLAAALLAPFGMLPERLGGVLWRLLNAGAFLAALAWWLRHAAPRVLSRNQRAAVFLFALPLAVSSLNNGQSNLLLIGLLLAGITGVATERWHLAAGCVALACLLKLYPLALGLLLALLYPRRFAGPLAAALALGLALPFALQRPEYVVDQYATWVWLLWGDDRHAWPAAVGYQDFGMLCRTWHVPLGPLGYLAVQLGAAALLARACLAGQRTGWPRRRLLAVVLMFATCWMTLLGPATEASTYALLAPALAWAVVEAFAEPRRLVARALPCLSLALFLLAGVTGWLPWRAELRAWGVYPLAALVLVGGLIALQRGERPLVLFYAGYTRGT